MQDIIYVFTVPGNISATMDTAADTRMARRAGRCGGQHFRQSRAGRLFCVNNLEKISKGDAKALFPKRRWPRQTGACLLALLLS